MKTRRNVVLMIAALTLAGIFAGTANAQQPVVRDAHFTLPFRAMWADTVLPPGDYTLSVDRLSGGSYPTYTVTFAGAGKKKTILALRPLGSRVGESSMLILESGGAMRYVRALYLPTVNLDLTFAVPKTRQTLVAEATEYIQSVPVSIAGQ